MVQLMFTPSAGALVNPYLQTKPQPAGTPLFSGADAMALPLPQAAQWDIGSSIAQGVAQLGGLIGNAIWGCTKYALPICNIPAVIDNYKEGKELHESRKSRGLDGVSMMSQLTGLPAKSFLYSVVGPLIIPGHFQFNKLWETAEASLKRLSGQK